MSWAGTLLQIVGVFGLSTRFICPSVAFATMLTGSVIWMVLAARRKMWSLATLNAAFCVSNVIGIYQWAP